MSKCKCKSKGKCKMKSKILLTVDKYSYEIELSARKDEKYFLLFHQRCNVLPDVVGPKYYRKQSFEE